MYLQEELETVDIRTGIGPELDLYTHMRSKCKHIYLQLYNQMHVV